ncbi:MAG: lamin tail domain-containing protein [Cyclobacteriaceae bacterium]|nr:lamin tail domain-containing protein [Cyclobacteriaceae bacterium HetDA_MAG_MS6]
MKHIYLLFVWPACFCYTLCAQVKDDFSDNDFDNRPMWTGNDENFEITTGELHLVAPAETAESYLSTANGLVKNTTWEFYFRFEQNPSGSNKAFVYLVSDQAELQRSLNGYYVLIGNSSDEISLYRQDGTKSTELIDGVDDVVDSNPVNVRVRVTRDSIGNWELLRDATGGTNYSSEGTAFDATYTSTSYFGINCDYTSTRSTLFYFDDFKISAPLQIDTVQIIANDSIHVQFNTPVANNEQVSNYEITGSSDTISIGFVKRSIVDSSLVQIRLNEPLLSDSYQLTIGGIEEVIEETFHDFSIDFAYKALALVSKEVLSDSSLILTFNDSLNTIQTDNFFIDQSIGNPVSTQLQNSDSAQVVLIFDQKFEDGIEYLLTISEVENLLENSSFSGTSEIEFVLPLIPENAVALIKNTLRVDFNKKLDKTTTETNEHYFLDGVNPVGAALQANDSSVLLTFENAFNSGPFSLEINGLKDNRGNVMTPASVGFEYLELLVLQTEQVGDSINVKFNQLLDLVSAMNHGNYSVLGTNPVSVSHKSDSTVSLLFPHLVNNRYELIIDGVDNRSGNATAESLTFDFFFETLTSSRTIVFNEIMADPNPSVALPIAEYIELYNASNTSINLRNFTMNEATLPDSSISAKSYALVIDDSNIEDFRDFENLIVVSNFGALNNGGEPLVLRDQFGNTVDSLHYNIHWYDDVEKASGGYALEQINPHLPCPDDFNWTASLHEIGGTPGLQNSLFDTIPDTMSPELTDFQVIGGNLIKLSFSESIDASSMTIGAFALPQNSIVAVDQTSFSTVELFLAQDLVSEVFHDLSLSGLHDCSGNEMMDLTIHFYHDLLTPSLLGLEIVSDSEITLVFSEPLSESVAEDEKHYNLGSIQPLKAILQDSATQKVVLSFDTLFLENEIYEVNLVGIQDTMGNATDTLQSAFVYLDHVKGTQVVAENLMTIFFKEMIAESTIGPQNFLLEEIGRPDQIVLDSKDQSVVRLSFSENIDDNTAYRLFMRKILNTHGDSLITPAAHVFWDTKGPVPDELLLLSDRALEINFNEPLRPEVAINVLNYQRSDGEQPIEAVLTDPSSVKLIFDTPFEVEMEQTLTVKNLQDVLGNKMTSARTMSFLYDPLPPTLDSAFVLAPDQVQVQFSEPLLQNALVNENFKINDKNPTNIRLLGPDSTTIVLGFSEEFPEVLLPYKLEYLEDRNGNEITNPITGEINYVNAVLSRIQLLTPEIVQLTFNRAMETAAVDRLNYQLSDIYIDTVKQVDERTFQLVLAKSLAFQTDYDLELGDILDLGGQSLLHHRYTFTFEPYFTSLEVIDDRTLELLFSTSFTSLASTAFAIDDQSPQFLSIDPENRGKVRLVFEEPFAANKNLTLSWQLLTDRYGRVVPSYGYSFLLDDQPPYLSHIESDFFNTVKIVFNETIDPSTALSVSQYEILEQGNPSRVDQEGNTSFLLVFDSLVIGMEYTIQVKNISDESGNFLESDSLTFIYQPPVVPEAGSVIVTEIMADPSPSVGLPEAEYVELHNTTSDTINLRSMMMTDGMAVLALPNAQLAPEGYYVISGDKLFNLGNDGDSVVLTDVYGHLIDRVVYTRDWYRDTEKDDGGYSLELINPSSPCGGQANWIASGAESGGTPGYQNSVFNLDPDGVSPFVVGHHLIGTDQLLVNFNETIDTTTIHLSGFLSDLLIENFSFSEDEVILTFRDDLKNGELLHLTISGVKDCAGNVIEETTLSFGLGKKPAYNELLITEIMADPEPVVGLPSIEYLEIYNASDFLISLEQVRIADEGSTADLSEECLVPESIFY